MKQGNFVITKVSEGVGAECLQDRRKSWRGQIQIASDNLCAATIQPRISMSECQILPCWIPQSQIFKISVRAMVTEHAAAAIN